MRGKFRFLLASLTMLSMLVAACGGGGGATGGSGTTPSPAPSSAPGGGGNETPAETPAPPAEITYFVSDHNLAVPSDDDPRLKYMEEKANVDLKVEYLPHGQYLDQLNLKFASGEFPSVYQSWSGPAPELVEGGKIVVLNDLIEQYGPNLKKNISEDAWSAVTVKGDILAVPQPSSIKSGQVMFIRKDWLDKLGLDIPKTSDELLEVMRAFRDGDPNGNGKKDEIAFSMRENISWSENIWGMWGIGTAWTEYYYNGEVILGNIHPNILKPLEYLRTMHAEGLLDSEFLTNNRSTWEQKIKAGLAGIWNHDPTLITQWNKDLQESIPEQNPEVIVIPTPQGAGYDGPVGSRWSPIAKTFIVTTEAKDPAAVIRWLDWLMSEEGQLYTNLGVEGDTYTVAGDGSYEFNSEKSEEIGWLTLFSVGGYHAEATKAKLNDDAAFEKLNEAYTIANTQGWPNEAIGMPPIADEKNMTTMFREIAAKVIVGQADLAAYEQFMKDWRAQGGEELVKERTEWYNQNRLNQ